jgi:hypothetical protein
MSLKHKCHLESYAFPHKVTVASEDAGTDSISTREGSCDSRRAGVKFEAGLDHV